MLDPQRVLRPLRIDHPQWEPVRKVDALPDRLRHTLPQPTQPVCPVRSDPPCPCSALGLCRWPVCWFGNGVPLFWLARIDPAHGRKGEPIAFKQWG